MKMKFNLIIVLLCLVPPIWARGPIKVITTTEDLAALTRAVAGNLVKVESLTPGTRDPHYAEAKPSMIRKVARADLLLLIGAELEIGWLPALLDSARNRKVMPGATGFLDFSSSVRLLGVPTGPVDRSMGDVHPMGNPHYWLNPGNGILMARAISHRLGDLDPDHQDEYEANFAAFEAMLKSKIQVWREEMAVLSRAPVIAYHTSFIYLADAFGFEIVDQIEPKPGIAPSASHLNRLVARIENENISLIIMEPFYNQRPARYLNEQTGIRVAVVPQSVGAQPEIKAYPDLFDEIVNVLVSNRGGGNE